MPFLNDKIQIMLIIAIRLLIRGWRKIMAEERENYIRFEVLTAVVMKSTVFWDITPCGPLLVNRRFGGAELCLLLAFTLVSCSSYSSTLKM
jgi:hypothetical protein